MISEGFQCEHLMFNVFSSSHFQQEKMPSKSTVKLMNFFSFESWFGAKIFES